MSSLVFSSFAQKIIFYSGGNAKGSHLNNDFRYEGNCKNKPEFIEEFVVNTTNQIVMWQTLNIDDNSVIREPRILENCKIIDLNNWTCGGQVETLPNGRTIAWQKHSVMNGVMYKTPLHTLINGRKVFSDPNQKICFYEKTINGYRLLPYFDPKN